MKKVFIVDDNREITDLLQKVLTKAGYQAEGFYDAPSAIAEIKDNPPNLVLLDIQMPEMNGFEALKHIKRLWPDLKVIIITAYAGIDNTMYFLNNGAVDYIAKPFKLSDIRNIVARVINDDKLSDQDMIEKRVKIIGHSDGIKECIDIALKLSNSASPLLITGESGTGKELFTDFIHYNSVRKYSNLIKINCAAIPRELLESELFGYQKGAFTGALSNKPGKLELGDNGTVFLDEIGELDKDLQAKLLRVLEYNNFERLGSNETINSNFRLICATNKDLEEEVRAGTFREDLYYRINPLTIHIPPLRERREDIEALIDHFLSKVKEDYITCVSRISEAAMDRLIKYQWPGNVRELRGLIYRICSLTSKAEIAVEDLPQQVVGEAIKGNQPAVNLSLEYIEKNHISKVLELYNGSKKQAAKALGICEKTLYNKLEKYNIAL